MTDTIRTVPITGGRLAYVEAGSGRPVVLLHGGGLDHRMWDEQIPALAEHHRVVAVDARGHGRSSTPTEPFRPCDDVAELLATLDIDSAALVGLSMGAGTAVDTAVEHPDLVEALVVSGTGTSSPDWRDPWVLDILATWERTQHERDADGWIAAFLSFAPGPYRSTADVDPRVVARLREMVTDTLANHVPDGDPVPPTPVPDVVARAAEIAVPVLAVVGGLDSTDHVRMATELATRVTDGRVVTIDGTAHYPNMEQPDAFTEAVLRFLGQTATLTR